MRVKAWARDLIEKLKDLITNPDENQKLFSPENYARLILIDFIKALDGYKELSRLVLAKGYSTALTSICSKNSIRDHLGQKENMFFVSSNFTGGDLMPHCIPKLDKDNKSNLL